MDYHVYRDVLYRSSTYISAMITILKFILGVIILCGVPGVIMGLYSAYRDGALQRDWGPAYLRFKKFAQQKFFNRTTWVHIKSYWMYYGFAFILIAMGFTDG